LKNNPVAILAGFFLIVRPTRPLLVNLAACREVGQTLPKLAFVTAAFPRSPGRKCIELVVIPFYQGMGDGVISKIKSVSENVVMKNPSSALDLGISRMPLIICKRCWPP